MEPVGFAVGVIALAGIFKDCIDLFSLIETARYIERDYGILVTKFDIEKTIFLQWAERVRLLEPENYDKRLDSESTGESVIKILSSIRGLFTESTVLQTRYGLKKEESPEVSPEVESGVVSVWRHNRFSRRFHDFQARQTTQGLQSLSLNSRKPLNKARWVIQDKAKFENLIQDLSYFTGRLNDIIPGSVTVTIKEDFEKAATGVEDLKIIEAAVSDRRPMVARAASERVEQLLETAIIERLYFPELTSRQENIVPQHTGTFRWALEHRPGATGGQNILNWLQSGSNIFWIGGKAGSGKSTLMKFLFESERTQAHLKAWGGGSDCLTVAYFFWRLGTNEQKSQMGLFRAVLYQILKSQPSLCRHLVPRMWKNAMDGQADTMDLPTPKEMREMPIALAKISSLPKTCLFVDGLDELSGDHSVAIEFIKALEACASLKIMVSSRPEPLFVAEFGAVPQILLENLNYEDIQRYVRDKIWNHKYVHELKLTKPQETMDLLHELVTKAKGVFLWVVLACRSLTDGFMAFDRVDELKGRIKRLPPELEALFQHMLQKVDGRYYPQAAKLLKICHLNKSKGSRPLCALGLALLDDHDFDTSRIPEGTFYSRLDAEAKCTHMEGRLRSRVGGLVELHRLPYTRENGVEGCPCGDHHSRPRDVEFMHRTVFDFLDDDKVWGLEGLKTNEGFDPGAAIACYSLHMLRLCLSIPVKTAPPVIPKGCAIRPNIDRTFDPDFGRAFDHGFGPDETNRRDSVRSYNQQRSIDDIFFFASFADDKASDLILPVMFRFEEFVMLVQANWESYYWRALHGEAPRAIAVRLAIEAGMTNLVKSYLPLANSVECNGSQLYPLLYHAILPAMFTTSEHFSSVAAGLGLNPLMVGHLLDMGCDPNEEFFRGGQSATPWAAFRVRLKSPQRIFNADFTNHGLVVMEFLSRTTLELGCLDEILTWAKSPSIGTKGSVQEMRSARALQESIVRLIRQRLSREGSQSQSHNVANGGVSEEPPIENSGSSRGQENDRQEEDLRVTKRERASTLEGVSKRIKTGNF